MKYLKEFKEFELNLKDDEKSKNTIEKYMRDVSKFLKFIDQREIEKSLIIEYKLMLCNSYAVKSINSMIASINSFLSFLGLDKLRIKTLKEQREIFANPKKELTKQEYHKLIEAAQKSGDLRLSLLIQTICSTGIRVSELKFITVKSLKLGKVNVSCKSKKRMVFLPKELIILLKQYCKIKNIKNGIVFCSKNGKALDRSNIWRMMKNLCDKANVSKEKVFPHNLRHLFARTYYKINKDISKLADILGHSNINTTRIYTMESGNNHLIQLEKLDLIVNKKKQQHNCNYVVVIKTNLSKC